MPKEALIESIKNAFHLELQEFKEEKAKVQDIAEREASETYSKLHISMQMEMNARFDLFERKLEKHQLHFDNFLEAFKNHMQTEEADRKEMIELIKSKADISVQNDVKRAVWIVITAIIVALLGLVLKP
jgi:hypothetical protein